MPKGKAAFCENLQPVGLRSGYVFISTAADSEWIHLQRTSNIFEQHY